MIYEAKRRSIFICDEYELALLHCFGAIWGGGTNHDGHGLYGLVASMFFPHLFGDFHARIMVYCTKQFFIPVWWSVYTEGFLPGAKLDAHGLTIDCVRYS
jgi:hypothetical protein